MDDIDRAKELETRQRAAALAAQKQRAQETEAPLIVDGVRYCLDCGDPIPAARLAARPESVRCIDCKEIRERRLRRPG